MAEQATGVTEFMCYPKLPYKLLDGLTKIKLTASEYKSQARNAKDPEGVKAGKNLAIFNFIAPNEMIETAAHEWESYDSGASKLQELAATAEKTLSELSSAWKGMAAFITPNKKGEGGSSSLRALMTGNVTNTRIDTPLVYKNSTRRQYEFTFNMGYYSDPEKEIIIPVKQISSLSCAVLPKDNDTGDNNFARVKPPCIWEIDIEPNSMIFVPYAALMSVQPTYKGPFHKGFPSSCELHLSFTELTPLWNTAYEQFAGAWIVQSTESGG